MELHGCIMFLSKLRIRRCITGAVDLDCRPGPKTVLTKEEEDRLAGYCIEMADRGFGLTREDVMRLAFQIAERTRPNDHSFKDGLAGHGWYEGFRSRHLNLTVRTPQPLSYCSANPAVLADFFSKLGAICGQLNLFTKPMQIFNLDETAITIVHKPGKVITDVTRCHVYSLISAEEGKTHTVLSCVSVSGLTLPPMIIFPQKTAVPDTCQGGAPAGTLFKSSENGWINSQLFLEYIQFLIKELPPKRPVLFIQDGHASHLSLDVIDLARANDMHLLCLPAHTTHILQPLDEGVFKSFKNAFSKACREYTAEKPGRVVTVEVLASLLGKAWPTSHTPVNILSGFRKCGIYPLNPGQIDDRQIAPSKVFSASPTVSDSSFTEEENKLFETRYNEGYNVPDERYELWLSLKHPNSPASTVPSISPLDSASVVKSNVSAPTTSSATTTATANSVTTTNSATGTGEPLDALSELFKLPEPAKKKTRKKKVAVNTNRAVCITDSDNYSALNDEAVRKEDEKRQKEEQKQLKAQKKSTEEGN